MKNCQRCSGKGFLEGYRHIENGICFECKGTGKVEGEEIITPVIEERKMYWDNEKRIQKELIDKIETEYKDFIKLKKRSEETEYSLAEYGVYFKNFKDWKIEYSCTLNKHKIKGVLQAVEKSKNSLAEKMYKKFKSTEEGKKVNWSELEEKYIWTDVRERLHKLLTERA